MIDLSRANVYDDPYPYAVAGRVIDESFYPRLVKSYPPESLFAYMGNGYHKYSLSERNNPAFYHRFIAETEGWREFYHYVKSVEFQTMVFQTLITCRMPVPFNEKGFKARFEFSSLPVDGGFLAPHTDIPSKVLTLVIPMYITYWDTAWGGGTEILKPKDSTQKLIDYQAPWDAFERTAIAAYVPNNCLIFLKSDVSWHGVYPIGGKGVKEFRRTITINLEKVQ